MLNLLRFTLTIPACVLVSAIGLVDSGSEALLLLAEHDGPTMLARIGIMQALNRDHVQEFNHKRKEPHWGRRKLARDR
jgi:hypothetical protein